MKRISRLPRETDYVAGQISEGYCLSSGREVSAHQGLLSVGEQGDAVFHGYDDEVILTAWADGAALFTANELHEIADTMIARWQQFKAHVDAGKVPSR